MATVLEEKDELVEQKPVTPAVGSGSSASSISQPKYTAPSQQQQAGGGGRFTNISKYLQANQGGGQQLQQGIVGKQDQQAQQIRQGIEQSQQKFQQAYQPEKERLEKGSQFVGGLFPQQQPRPDFNESIRPPRQWNPEQLQQRQQEFQAAMEGKLSNQISPTYQPSRDIQYVQDGSVRFDDKGEAVQTDRFGTPLLSSQINDMRARQEEHAKTVEKYPSGAPKYDFTGMPLLDSGIFNSRPSQSQQPTDLTSLTPEQIQQFRDIATGKGAFKDITGLSGTPSTDPLQKAAKAAGSEQGRFSLLKSSFNTPNYTGGQQRLDQLLLGLQQPKNLQRQLGATAQSTEQFRQGAVDEASKQALALSGQAGELAGQATSGVSGEQKALEEAVLGRAGEKQAVSDELKGYLQSALGGQGISEDKIERALQLAQQEGINLQQDVYDINKQSDFRPEQFLNTQQFTPETIASPEERARANVLAQLAGQEQTFLSGQASNTPNLLNQQALEQATSNRRSVYESEANPYQQNITGLTPAIQLQKDLQSGMDPVQAFNKAVSSGLNPDVAENLRSGSKEFQDPTGGISGGTRAGYSSLSDRLNAQNFLPTYQRQIAESEKQINEIRKKYGVGSTLENLIRAGINIPTTGTDYNSLPNATGPAGKVGLL